MTTVDVSWRNSVVTINAKKLYLLDDYTSRLLNIIDRYGGTNPFPRFFIHDSMTDGKYFYSCTTKIPKDSLKDFNEEVYQLKEMIDNTYDD